MNRRRFVAAATRVAAMVRIAGVLSAAGFVLGCDVMQQDVDVTVPWRPPSEETADERADDNDSGGPPGGEDVEDQAQKHEVERWL